MYFYVYTQDFPQNNAQQGDVLVQQQEYTHWLVSDGILQRVEPYNQEALNADPHSLSWKNIEVAPAYTQTIQEAQPAVLDEQGAEVTPAQPAVTQDIPAQFGFRLVLDQDKKTAIRQKKANDNLNTIRSLRNSKLSEADHKINTLEDDSQDASVWRAYRKELRECTDDLKKVNGEAKLTVESQDPFEFEFPEKP